MRLGLYNPIYRKVIVPWYDSEIACLITLILMLLLFLFGFVGISVATGYEEFRSYMWIPGLLIALSSGVIISITVRLVKRYLNQLSN